MTKLENLEAGDAVRKDSRERWMSRNEQDEVEIGKRGRGGQEGKQGWKKTPEADPTAC